MTTTSTSLPWMVTPLKSPVPTFTDIPKWKPPVENTLDFTSDLTSKGYKKIHPIEKNICIFQDPIGNFVLVMHDDKNKSSSQEFSQKISQDLKERFFNVAFPLVRGISIIQSGKVLIMLKNENEISEIIYDANHSKEFFILPVIFHSDITEDIETAIDSVEIVTTSISNIIQDNCLDASNDFSTYVLELQNISSIMEKIPYSIETITSLSRIYHEITAESFVSNVEQNPLVMEKLSSINQTTFDFLSLGIEIAEANREIENALSRLKIVASEVTRIHNILENMDSI